jgi:acyl-coenzyme A thioesterase PaaI-like protein
VSATPELPDGFEPHFRKSPVTEPWEPLYSRPGAECIELGLIVAGAHCNSRGFVHGGVIAALADNAMGLSYGVVRRRAGVDSATYSGAVTVSLGLDYAASAKVGQWLQITPRVLKAGRSIGFVDALVTADGDIVARASATFRLVE